MSRLPTANAQFCTLTPGGQVHVTMSTPLHIMSGEALLQHVVAYYGNDVSGFIWVYVDDYDALSNRMRHVFHGTVMEARSFLQTPGGA
jgi:hypothetical protein